MKPDGSIGTAGKGPLIQTDISATLGVSQDQYLFVPKELCLNDQGGGVMYVSYGKTGTLRREMKHHEPIVMMEKDSDLRSG